MDQIEIIRIHLKGAAGEQGRREELLRSLLDAFARGGSDAVASELTSRLAGLERAFDAKVKELDPLLS
jgi:hypothetical protein